MRILLHKRRGLCGGARSLRDLLIDGNWTLRRRCRNFDKRFCISEDGNRSRVINCRSLGLHDTLCREVSNFSNRN
jgi:hypothetical protein